MRSFRFASALLIAGVLACGPAADEIREQWTMEMIDVPAKEGSRWSDVSSDGDGLVLSWLEPDEKYGWSFRAARYDGVSWTEPSVVARSEDRPFFVNWADFPSVRVTPGGKWSAHWLLRGPMGGYDYGIQFAQSTDEGRSWTEVWTPHEDGTPTEHGFVTIFAMPDGGAGLVWLDGRKFVEAGQSDGGRARPDMTLRFRSVGADGTPGPETLLDDRTCDCCQTDAAITSQGPVVVYRDRTKEEIRDIYMTRLVNGEWTDGEPVHDDGWVIRGCPVNGPGVSARGDDVAVAWFSGGQNTPRVQLAFSDDAGATFGAPVRLDEGNPLGRTDVLLLEDGSALVSWMERDGRSGSILARRVSKGGALGPVQRVTANSAGRDSGFPRMTQDSKGRVLFTWTLAGDGGRVQMARTTAPVGLD